MLIYIQSLVTGESSYKFAIIVDDRTWAVLLGSQMKY